MRHLPRPLALLPLPLLLACAEGSVNSGSTGAGATDSGGGEEGGVSSAACEVVGDRPAGWADATHADGQAVDLERALGDDRVHQLRLTVSAEDYAASFAELEELTGVAFGAMGGGSPEGGGGPPDGEPPEGGGPAGEGGATELLSGDPSYFPVRMEVDGTTWCEVGMRWKGNSSLVQTWGAGIRKLPFRLDFDEYEDEHPEIDDQRYYGLEELVFGNGQGDDTLIREMLAADILAERGIPVAQSAFYQVWLDSGEGSTYLGLYTATEDPSDDLMERLYGDDQGNLYKPDGTCADLTCFDEESFEKKNNESAADWSDAQALVEALNGDRSDPAAWRAELEASLDVQAWLRWLAVNTAMENWDTYGGLAHNYYLYARPDDGGRLAWVPWDHNLSLQDSFTGSTDPMYDDLGEEWPLIRYLLDDPEYRADYEEALVWSQEGLLDEELLAEQSAARAEQVREALFGEGGEVEGSTFLTNEADWESALQSLLEHSAQRRSAVEAALNR